MRGTAPGVEVHPLTPDRWDDLVDLFGPKGAQEGCWCMYFRQTAREWKAMKGEGNKRALRDLVRSGTVPGLLAYSGGEPVGWVGVAPREDYVRFRTSRVMAPVDDTPVWSIVCFFVRKGHRDSGLTVELLRAAARYARERGATVLEGYPNDTRGRRGNDAFMFAGLMSAFERAGFKEVARRSEKRPVMRLELGR